MKCIISTWMVILLLQNIAQAQIDFTTKDIAAMEAAAHSRLVVGRGGSFSSNNFDVHYYRCQWEIDPAVRYISGSVTMYFTITSPTNNISFDLMNSLQVDSIKQQNNLLSFTTTTNTVTVNFAANLPLGKKDSISIYYKGIPAETGFGSFIQTSHAGTPIIWSLSEPYGARDWWPCKNGLDDKADSIDIFITHPNIYKAAANGLLQSEIAVAGNKTITHWKHRYPIATYLIAIAVTNYVVFNNTVQLGNTTLPMQTHCYPESLALFQQHTPNVLYAMNYFHNTYGDYPFIKEKYGHVQFGWGGGMEHQTATFIVSPGESLMAHELGHQWFGDKLTTSSWADIWLNEGFATYLALDYAEARYPADILPNRLAIINHITLQPGGSVRVDDTTNVSRIFSSRLSYNKGCYLVMMLRWMLGDEKFFRAIKNYSNDPALAYKFVNTANLKMHLEQVYGKDLSTFFNQWYTGQGYPSYQIEWSPIGNTMVRFKMNQTTSHPSVSFFEMPVALKFKNATQEKTIVVNHTSNGQMFNSEIGFLPDTVLVDPELWLISKNNSSKKVLLSNTGQAAVEINPNPVTAPMSIFLHDFNADVANLTILNATGQLMYKENITLLNGAAILSINNKHWAKGIYVVTVKAGNKKIVKRVLQ